MRTWKFVIDMNQDGQFSGSDIWAWSLWLYFYPGDWFIKIIMEQLPKFAQLVSLSEASYQGLLPGFISAVCWLYLLLIISKLLRLFRADDGHRRTDSYLDSHHLLKAPSWLFLSILFILFILFVLYLGAK
ncbi:hypothetical protein [Dongshaea marina]|uniref:hypothetical protein n=1 Tax=Dongshaea marina TaxID=2047966 RepID=UPI000D3ECC50|nr:hypothetical protein [Dongshaea marina]